MVVFASLLVLGSLLSLHTINGSFGIGIIAIIALALSLLGIGGLVAANIKKARWMWLSTAITSQVVILFIIWPVVRFGLPLIVSMHGGDATSILPAGLAMPSTPADIIPLAALPVIAIVLVAIKNKVFHASKNEGDLDE